jgi:hypothetical protein
MSRRFRHRIRLVRDQSSDGSNTPDYSSIGSGFPCHIMPKSTYEGERGKQLEAGVSHVIELRYYCGFKPNDIVENEFNGVRYSLKGVINVAEMNRDMELHANEIVV